jgi:hypothetical protein
MIRTTFNTLILLVLTSSVLHSSDKVDWEKFLSRQDPVWEKLPTRFDHGAFLGNGMLGTTIFQDGGQAIRFEIGRSDVTDHRRDNARLPIGGMLLKTVGKIQSGTLRTDLWNAEVRGEVVTDKGKITFRAIDHAIEVALIVDFQTYEGEKGAMFEWSPKTASVYRDEAKKAQIEPNPPSEQGKDGEVGYSTQRRVAGGSYTAAWAVQPDKRLTFTIIDTYPALTSQATAISEALRLSKIASSKLEKSHRAWWHAYYPESFVSVPDAQVEGFYWNQMYKLASATRKDRIVIDLLGPWYRETGWPRIWWNLNIQIAYAPVYAANRLELGESFTRFIDAKRNSFIKNAKDIYGFDDCATTPHTTDYEGLRGDGTTAPDHYINPGDFTWGLFLYWQQYRYSMDASLVTDQKKHAFYPLLKASVNLYLHVLKTGDDGKLHLPKFHSPEYSNDEDNNYNLSLLRWACGTLLALNERYQLNDPQKSEWENVLKNLVAYPQDENGFRIGANISFEHSHRHWSHLLMIHPLCIFDFEEAASKELYIKSLKHFETVENQKGYCGFTYPAVSSMYAYLGDGAKALENLIKHHRHREVMPNTQYVVGYPTIECSICAADALQQMLLQSWGGVIRVFPAVPDEWKDAAFRDLRTEGAFLMTAVRKEGKTQWLKIKSLAGEPCIVRPGFEGAFKSSNTKLKINDLGNGNYELPLKKGQEVTLYVEGVTDFNTAPCALPAESANFWGVKK